MRAKDVQARLRSLSDAKIAAHSQCFFKTAKGEYGEGDQFLGIRVPVIRGEVKQTPKLPLEEIDQLLTSPFHEVRQFALLLMVKQYGKADSATKTGLYQLYLDRTRYINNWDLIDCSAHKLVGPYLADKSRRPLYKLAESRSLWERRIAIMSTLHFIKRSDFIDTLAIAEILLKDEEDLIHKAVGWMLREVGKLEPDVEHGFLRNHYLTMPRTMLRYAIERMPEKQRQAYLNGTMRGGRP